MTQMKPTAQEKADRVYRHNVDAIRSALDIMLAAEDAWDGLPATARALDTDGISWIAAALASEGIGKL